MGRASKMANVFTRRSGLPRTTTLKDFRDPNATKALLTDSTCKLDNKLILPCIRGRPRSPTRRQNPQPLGLKYQQPYNRYGQTFGIWHPNKNMSEELKTRVSLEVSHTRRTNFSCNHDVNLYKIRKNRQLRTKSLEEQCSKINSNQFQDPRKDTNKQTEQRAEYYWDDKVKYWYNKTVSPCALGKGIVPDVFGWSAKR